MKIFKQIIEGLHRIADSIEKSRVAEENKGIDELRITALEAKVAELWSFFLTPDPKNPEENKLSKKGKKFTDWFQNRKI